VEKGDEKTHRHRRESEDLRREGQLRRSRRWRRWEGGGGGHGVLAADGRSSTEAVTDKPGRRRPGVEPSPSSRMRAGTRWTIVVKLPVAFSGGRTLNWVPVAGARLARWPGNTCPGNTSASTEAGSPGRIPVSWLSLKLASTHKPRAGTIDISCAPIV